MGCAVPQFKHHAKDPANRHLGFIEVNGIERYWIDDPEDFYRAFGYSSDMRKSGILPDEFIWEAYTKTLAHHKNLLYQIHMLEYLIEHSPSFREKYRTQYPGWFECYAEEFTGV